MPVNMKFTYRQETILEASESLYSTIETEFRNFPGSPVLSIGIIPGGGTKSLYTGPCGQKKKKKT